MRVPHHVIYNDKYYIKYFYISDREEDIDKFLTLSDCKAELDEWSAGSDTQCELMEEYNSERKIKINTRVIDNQVTCLASLGEYDFDNEPSHVPTVVQNFINAHPEMECEYDGSTVGCILDNKFQISIDPWGLLNIFEIEAVYGPKKNNIPYNDYYTCVDPEDNYPVCFKSGGYYYAYDQDSDEYSTMAECESYHSVSNGENGCGLKGFNRSSFSCSAGGGPENTCSGNEFI